MKPGREQQSRLKAKRNKQDLSFVENLTHTLKRLECDKSEDESSVVPIDGKRGADSERENCSSYSSFSVINFPKLINIK